MGAIRERSVLCHTNSLPNSAAVTCSHAAMETETELTVKPKSVSGISRDEQRKDAEKIRGE